MESEKFSICIVRPFQTLLRTLWRASLLGSPDGGSPVSPQVPASAPCGGSERRWDRRHQPTRTSPDFHLHRDAIRGRHSLSEHRRTDISHLAWCPTAPSFIFNEIAIPIFKIDSFMLNTNSTIWDRCVISGKKNTKIYCTGNIYYLFNLFIIFSCISTTFLKKCLWWTQL